MRFDGVASTSRGKGTRVAHSAWWLKDPSFACARFAISLNKAGAGMPALA